MMMVMVEDEADDIPTSHCFLHMSMFFLWALEKWSQAFCLEVAANTALICSTGE